MGVVTVPTRDGYHEDTYKALRAQAHSKCHGHALHIEEGLGTHGTAVCV